MKWLRRLIRAWLVLRPIASSPEATPWTDADSSNLGAFLASETGLRLGASVRQRLAQAAQHAITDRGDSAWSCGHASGMHTMIAILDSYAAESGEKLTADDRPSDSLDWLNPQPKTQSPNE